MFQRVAIFLVLIVTLATTLTEGARAQDVFAGGDSRRTGTQGVVGNPNCAPPTVIENGKPVTPLNWSCDSSGYWAKLAPPPAPANPCEPDYNMSTPAGRAAAQRLSAQNQQACNAERCKHNPTLLICQVDPRTNTTGGNTSGDGQLLKVGTGNNWEVWQRKLADAINKNFRKNMQKFPINFGAQDVPLKITQDYTVKREPWNYNGKLVPYHVVPGNVTMAGIPDGMYNLSSGNLNTLRQNFLAVVQKSILDVATTDPSALEFPANEPPPKNNQQRRSATFSTLPGDPVVYDPKSLDNQ